MVSSMGHAHLRNRFHNEPSGYIPMIRASDLDHAFRLVDKAATVLCYFQIEEQWDFDDLMIYLVTYDGLDEDYAFDLITALVELEELYYDEREGMLSW